MFPLDLDQSMGGTVYVDLVHVGYVRTGLMPF